MTREFSNTYELHASSINFDVLCISDPFDWAIAPISGTITRFIKLVIKVHLYSALVIYMHLFTRLLFQLFPVTYEGSRAPVHYMQNRQPIAPGSQRILVFRILRVGPFPSW